MIKVSEIQLNAKTKEAVVELFADTKQEVTDNVSVDQIPEDYTIAQGSTVLTASADFAFRKSDGTWSWL